MLTNKIIRKPQIIQVFNPSQNKVHECIISKGHYYNVIFHPLLNQFFGQSESLPRWHLFIAWWWGWKNIQKRSFPYILWLCGRKGHSMHSFWLRNVECLICRTRTLIWKKPKACLIKPKLPSNKKRHDFDALKSKKKHSATDTCYE